MAMTHGQMSIHRKLGVINSKSRDRYCVPEENVVETFDRKPRKTLLFDRTGEVGLAFLASAKAKIG